MQIIADRRYLHTIPELGRELPLTTQYVTQKLSELSCRVFFPIEHSVCAWFDFGCDSAIAFRADMDALPIGEKTGLDFASRHPGKMHACGHDGHMAMLLELARQLDQKKKLDKNVLLIFQPGEETPGGAEDICNTDLLEEYNVKAVFGQHLWPEIPAGKIASRPGELMSRNSELTVTITGRSSHIGRADKGLDAMAAGWEFYARAMELERSLPDGEYRLLKFGKLESGTARNAISAHTCMYGTLRTFRDEIFDHLRDGIYRIAQEVERLTGCKVDIHMNRGYPAVCNDPKVYHRVAEIMDILLLEEPSMISEDFSYYLQRVPGMFFFLGTGDTPALHADTFTYDEEVLCKGAQFLLKLAEEYKV